jgi:hypothetical protein
MHHVDGFILATNVLIILFGLGSLQPQAAGINVDKLQPWEVTAQIELVGDEKKIETFGRDQHRTGTITIDPKSGRIDTFDKYGNRTGYGQIEKDGNINLYDKFGNRTGSGRISR